MTAGSLLSRRGGGAVASVNGQTGAVTVRGRHVDSDDYAGIDKTGATDSAPAINQMLLDAVNKKCVLRKGTYKTLSTILVPSYTDLFIEPQTVIDVDPANAVVGAIEPGIVANVNNGGGSDQNITIVAYGVTFDYHKANSNRAPIDGGRGIYMNNVAKFRILGGTVQNTVHHGVMIAGTSPHFSIRDMTVNASGKDNTGAGGTGIAVSATVDQGVSGLIENCFLVNNWRCGVKIGTNPLASAFDLYEPITVQGCRATGNGLDAQSTGFQAEGPVGAANLFYLRGVTFAGCQAYSNVNAGFQFNIGVKECAMVGCQAWLNGQQGFFLFQGAQYNTLSACHAWNNSQSPVNTYAGFEIDATSVPCTHNRIIGCSSVDDQAVKTQQYAYKETLTAAVNTDNLYMGCRFEACATGTVSVGSGASGRGEDTFVLAQDTADVGSTSAAGEDTLYTYTIPAFQLGSIGDAIVMTSWGIFANNVRGKRLRLRFGTGPSIIGDTGAMAFAGSATDSWQVTTTITKDTATSVRTSTVWTIQGATLVAGLANASNSVVGVTLTGTTILRITGQVSASGVANDIVARGSKVTFVRAATP